MKKVSALILAVLVLISAVALVSCGGKPDATSGSSSSSVTKDTGFSSEVTEPTQSTATTATTETTITTTGTETTATTATTEEPVPEPILPEGKSLKVLAIGNSFSVDAMEYLYDIAKSAGYTDIVLGNLYIGGCTLEQHVGTLAKSTPSYDFYLNKGGKWTKTRGTIPDGLRYADWDVVTLQQASGLSGVEASYEPHLTTLIETVKTSCPDAKLVWHMTWAYQGNSSHSDFAKYGRSQKTMYDSILSAVRKAVLTGHKDDFAGVIPSGTAIQNIRTSYIGDTVTRDGYHLSYDMGRYTAALTWFRALTGADLSTVTYVPDEYRYLLGARATLAAKEAAENACRYPFEPKASTYVNDMDAETKKADLEKLGLNPDDYIMTELDIVPYAYYNSTGGMLLTSKAGGSTASNISNFAASRLLSKKEIPTGSVIVLESGWKYRPEGWRYAGAKNSDKIRPENTSEEVVRVTDEWWGRFVFRAFNLSKTDGTALTAEEAKIAANALRIYVPKAGK